MSYSSEVLADSPLLYWRLGDASGTTITDSSGNGRDGTYSNSPTLGATGALVGDSNKAVTFSGSGGQAGFISNAAWMAQSSFTIEAWVKGTGTSQIILGRAGTTTVGYIAVDGSGKLFIQSRNTLSQAQNRVGLTSINDGNWHHVVGVRDGIDLHVYVDGVLDDGSTAGTSAAVGSDSSSFNIASRGGGTPLLYAGTIDEAAFYGTALSGSRIAAHYTAGTTVPSTPATGTASLSLSASGSAKAAPTGTASLSLSASGTTVATAAGTASLTFDASGDTEPPQAATGTASLSLSASGAVGAGVTGTAFLTLIADGTAAGAEAAAGTASLSLSAFGSATLAAAGTALLELLAVGEAQALYVTDTSNSHNGRRRSGRATVTIDRPVAPTPPGVTFGQRYDKALAYPTPTMVDGRPT